MMRREIRGFARRLSRAGSASSRCWASRAGTCGAAVEDRGLVQLMAASSSRCPYVDDALEIVHRRGHHRHLRRAADENRLIRRWRYSPRPLDLSLDPGLVGGARADRSLSALSGAGDFRESLAAARAASPSSALGRRGSGGGTS